MKNLIRIAVLFAIIVTGVFVFQCTSSQPAETSTDSTEVVADTTAVSLDSAAAQ